ncbi:ABC transporter substrate-binding protein [Brevibacillus panacihumi]|uniref:ABC transporter substrate-binding protein n=1 Tax=Brevibacillus panacihumi TaxID=497735 RepID=A0A3M8DE56_9BACL|nr:ABC transporter substrate-binding protein [Brevibacillus panacihumi]RNB86326.1 ABC transporter substrate-binding protein [Brevibacillus panacihumi]
MNRKQKSFWNKMGISGVCAIAMLLSACGASQNTQGTASQSSSSQESEQSVVIQNNGREIRFTKAPERAVTLNQHVTEVMLALGLEDKMVGTAYLDDAILPAYKEAYDKIPVLSDTYPSKEVLAAADPDFVYSGWKSGFGDKGVGSMEELEQAGIQSYLHMSSNMNGPTTEDVFADIRNIGKIFRIEDRAQALISSMKQEMKEITDKLGQIDQPITVFVYDSGEDQPLTAANNYMTSLITQAGGTNIFADVDKGWTTVSWEEVVNRNPEVIVIVDYGDKTVDQKRDMLLHKPELADLPAIKNQKLIVLPLSAASEGVRAPIALKILAQGMYPERFAN